MINQKIKEMEQQNSKESEKECQMVAEKYEEMVKTVKEGLIAKEGKK